MTVFEFVFGLVSILASLALTQLVGGLVALIRHASRVRFSGLHALWMWIAFATTVGNWGSFWEMRTQPAWPAWLVLSSVAMLVGQYVLCALVSPETPAEGVIDLPAFHDREHRRYVTVFAALYALSIAYNFLLGRAGYYPEWLRDSSLSFAGAALAFLALWVRGRAVQYILAAVLAATTTYFMIVACNIGGA